jgi:hypothetical protein
MMARALSERFSILSSDPYVHAVADRDGYVVLVAEGQVESVRIRARWRRGICPQGPLQYRPVRVPRRWETGAR